MNASTSAGPGQANPASKASYEELSIAMDHVPTTSSKATTAPSDVENASFPRDSSTSARVLVPDGPAGEDARHSRFGGYKVYKRRWFGLFQLVLLNIIVSWDWLSFAAISKTAAEYFRVTESAINWLSTGFFLAFVAITPLVIYVLNKGPKPAIVTSATLILVGNWIRYAGARATGGHFGVVMFGQMLIGLAQPFVLAAPTRYSDLWFTDHGKISATAVASLANPLGAALGQLISPFWVESAKDVPQMVLYTAILSSIASLPAFFIPAKPPTAPSPTAALVKISLRASFHALIRSPCFFLILAPFSVYVGFFNALSSLLNQILGPYGASEDEAGICGAVLIVVGLVACAICSPLLDRVSPSKRYLPTIKIVVPIIAVAYLAFTFAPQTRHLPAPYVIAGILGAASFTLMPVALEYVTRITHPASPEVSSTICWAGGQLLGALFIIIMDALKADEKADPPLNMKRALIFETILACIVVPLPLVVGIRRLGLGSGNISDDVPVREDRDVLTR